MQHRKTQELPQFTLQAFLTSFCLTSLFSVLALLLNPAVNYAANENSTTEEAPGNEQSHDITYPDWFKTSFMELEEDILEARESGKRLMLVFHQTGCPYCNAFVERNPAQKDIEETVKSNFDVIEINMWGDLEVIDVDGKEFTEKTFARQLQVQFTPTVLMYDQKGAISLRINGYFPPEKFRKALDYVINENTEKQTFNEYLATVNAVSDGASTNAIDPVSYNYIDSDDFTSEDPISLPGTSNNKPYILLFEQGDCSNCLQLHNNVLAETTTLSFLDSFHIIRVDMWGNNPIGLPDNSQTNGRELARDLGISYAPTMVFYSEDHEEIIRSESWLKRFHTQTIFDYVISESWRNQPSFQNYLRDRANSIRQNGGVVDILE